MRAGLLVDHTGPDAPLGLAVSFLLELIQKSMELGWGSLCILEGTEKEEETEEGVVWTDRSNPTV